MTLQDILLGGGGGLFLLLTLIQITPIKLNPWSWLAGCIGRAINKEMMNRIDLIDEQLNSLIEDLNDLDTKVTNIDTKVTNLDTSLKNVQDKVKNLDKEVCTLEYNCEERNIILCRSRMLRFGDEILHGVKHSKDHFDQILLDCTNYEHYCDKHPDFLNNITEQTVNLINDTYKKCMKENSFL